MVGLDGASHRLELRLRRASGQAGAYQLTRVSLRVARLQELDEPTEEGVSALAADVGKVADDDQAMPRPGQGDVQQPSRGLVVSRSEHPNAPVGFIVDEVEDDHRRFAALEGMGGARDDLALKL